jgi:glycosyltransferase involved in cell wall biosynthesis
MRVLSFTTVFPSAAQPQHGLFVLERLRACARRAEIRVIAPRPFHDRRPAPRQETIGGLTVDHPTFWYTPRIGKPLDGFALYVSALATARRVAAEFRPAVIDAHFGYPDGFAAALLSRSLGLPMVVTLRGTEPLVGAISPMRRRALAWALSHARRVIAVSHPLATYAHALLAERDFSPPPPVTVIANGVDTDRFVPRQSAEARRALGIAEAGRLIVSVGHLSPRKGFQRVLRVLPDLVKTAPDLRFAIVGGPGAEGNNEADLRALTSRLGLADRVIFVGAAPPSSVASWLQAADVFVLASDHEGCPNVVWEAMACGVPVVATRVGEIPHMVPATAGLLIDEAEDTPALLAALSEALARTHDRAAIRTWAEQHTWDGVADRVISEWHAATLPSPLAACGAGERKATAVAG